MVNKMSPSVVERYNDN